MFNFLVIPEGPSCSGNLKEVLSSFLNDPERKVVGKAREIVLYL